MAWMVFHEFNQAQRSREQRRGAHALDEEKLVPNLRSWRLEASALHLGIGRSTYCVAPAVFFLAFLSRNVAPTVNASLGIHDSSG